MEQNIFTIIWDPMNGIALPYGKIDNWADQVVVAVNAGITTEISIGQELLIDAIRLKVKEGKLDKFQVLVRRFDGQGQSYVKKNGYFENPEKIYTNRIDHILDSILSAIISDLKID